MESQTENGMEPRWVKGWDLGLSRFRGLRKSSLGGRGV